MESQEHGAISELSGPPIRGLELGAEKNIFFVETVITIVKKCFTPQIFFSIALLVEPKTQKSPLTPRSFLLFRIKQKFNSALDRQLTEQHVRIFFLSEIS